jgi:DnaK suppressor protein
VTSRQSQLAHISGLLESNYQTLLEEVRDALESSENQQYVEIINRDPPDSGDEAIGDMLADLNLAIIDRHIQEIRDIEAARTRMKDGSFGTCQDCGGDIGFERLKAYPTAKRCITCQQKHERTYSHEGTPTL